MISNIPNSQQTLADFDWPFNTTLDPCNRWIKLSDSLPWEAIINSYNATLNANQGRRAKSARLVMGALIIKHTLALSDRETVKQIQENPYLQYFVGLPGYQVAAPFAPSLLVQIRRRIGDEVFESFYQTIIESVDAARKKRPQRNRSKASKDDNEGGSGLDCGLSTNSKEEIRDGVDTQTQSLAGSAASPTHQGELIVDATELEQAIRYPTNLGLLNQARGLTEQIIDRLYAAVSDWKEKPRTYRKKAHKAYLGLVKQKRPDDKALLTAIKQQLQYIKRNLGYIERLLDKYPLDQPFVLPRWLLYRYWVLQHVYAQQLQMYKTRSKRCDDQIMSISKPYVRPIVRGKKNKSVESASKMIDQ